MAQEANVSAQQISLPWACFAYLITSAREADVSGLEMQ